MSGHVFDRWTIPGPDGRRVHGPRWGKGQRYAVRWVEDGRERQRAAPTLAAARTLLLQVQGALAVTGTTEVAVVRSATVGAVADRWLPTITTETSRAWYESILRVWIRPRWGDVDVRDVTTAAVREWVRSLDGQPVVNVFRDGKRRTRTAADGRPVTLSASRRRAIGQTLRQVLQHAVDDDLIAANPCDAVRLPTGRGRGLALEPAELDRLLAALTDVHANALAAGLVMAYGGLRWGEMVALDAADLSATVETDGTVTGGALLVDDSYSEVGGRKVRGATKTAASVRVVPLPGFVAGHLARYLDGRTRGPLVPGVRGGRLSQATWRDWWTRAKADAGLELRAHDLRHTAASLLLHTGASLQDVMAIHGHTRLSTTADLYAHPIDRDARVRAAASRLDAVRPAALPR